MSSNPPRAIDSKDIRILTLSELEEDRVLQRDIHFTVSPIDCYKVGPEYDEMGHISPVNFRFTIDDSDNIYFFRNAWPISGTLYCLKTEDIIPSGIHTIDTSDDSIDQMLKEIQENHNGCIRCETSRTQSNGRTTIAVFDVHNRKTLKEALINNYPAILSLSKGYELPFNKPLMRVSRLGGIPQLYNAKTKTWEDGMEILGEYIPCYFKGKI